MSKRRAPEAESVPFSSMKGKVTLVTGGSKGIGSQVVFCSRSEEEGQKVQAELAREYGKSILFIKCDVANEAEIKNMIEGTVKAFGKLDCLINNAGVHPPHQTIDTFSVADFQKLLNINVVSMFTACKYALPHLRKVEGNIINLSSLVGSMAQVGAVTYVASKGAITAFSKALAIDEAAHNVRVNIVSPGNIWTPMWKEAVDAAPDPQRCYTDGANAQLLGRMGTIEESGRLCLYLASDATFTTGTEHLITGGAELAYGNKNQRKKDEGGIPPCE